MWHERSPEFREWWSRQAVQGRYSIEKTFHHPQVGKMHFSQMTLTVSDSPEQKLLIHVPAPNTDTAEKLRRLIPLSVK